MNESLPTSEPTIVPLSDLPSWIARWATETDDIGSLLDGIGGSFQAAGLPVRLLGFGTTALSATHRRVAVSWRPGHGSEARTTAHGRAGEEEHERTSIAAAVRDNQGSMRWCLERGEGCRDMPDLESLRAQGYTDYILDIARFPPGKALRGVGFFHATDRIGGFTDEEVIAIRSVRDVCSLAVLRFALSHALEDLLDAYVGSRASRRVMVGEVQRGKGELMSAAVLLADLKGFTATANREDPKCLVGWLDEHLEALGFGIETAGGEILKFTGDGFIAVFPVDDLTALPCQVCIRALQAARIGLDHNDALVRRRRMTGAPALKADLALHFGEVVYGNIGTSNRLDFTAIGRAINEASRIEALCDITGRSILMSDSFARRCEADLVDLGAFPLRGVATPLRLWTVRSDTS